MGEYPREPRAGIDYRAADLTAAMEYLILTPDDYSPAVALLRYYRDRSVRLERTRHYPQCRYCCRGLCCDCGQIPEACTKRGERPICADCTRVQGLVPAPVGKPYRETCTDGTPVAWMSQDFALDGETVRVNSPRSRWPRADRCTCAAERREWTAEYRGPAAPRCPHRPRVETYLRDRAQERAVARGLITASRALDSDGGGITAMTITGGD